MKINKKHCKHNKVSFSPHERIVSIPCRSSLQDVDSIWYSRKEIETITHDADQLVLEAEDKGTCLFTRDTLPDSLRGLERKTERGHLDSFRHRVAVYDAVLDSPSVNAHVNPIAIQSEQATREARSAAIQRAKQDQVEALAIYTHTNSNKNNKQELTLSDVFAKNPAKRTNDSSITVSTASLSSSEDEESLVAAPDVPVKVVNQHQHPRIRLVNGKPRPPPKRQSSSFKRTTHLPRKVAATTTTTTTSTKEAPVPTATSVTTKKTCPISPPTKKTTPVAPKNMVLPTTTSRSPKTLATTARQVVRGKRLSLDCACVFNAV